MGLVTVSVVVLLMATSGPSVLSEVLQTFEKCREFFVKGEPPVIPDVLNPTQEDVRYKKICQKSGFGPEGSGYTFATLYDTSNRIPVFSAYKYTGRGDFTRKRISWKIEPQLDPPVRDMTVPYNNQAIDEDYFENNLKLNRGHLFPNCFAPDEFTANSTFTLTNIVPQNINFNNGSWNRIENDTRGAMDKNCRDNNGKVLAYVLTGAVPGRNKLNDRVNIPSQMWMAFCCYGKDGGKQKWVSQAYWALNKEDKNKGKLNKMSLAQLQNILSQNWVKKVQLFKNDCA